MLRKFAMVTAFLSIAVSALGQSTTRGTVGTVSAVDAANNRFTMTPDDDRYNSVTVETDAVSTQYKGFGGTINGAPEIFVGSPGFANIHVGDRVDIRGTSRAAGVIAADTVVLLGRPVPADQTGVGQTRPPTSISPPTASSTAPAGSTATRPNHVEGVVRQVNTGEGRLVIETDQRQLITIRGSSATPVYYQGNLYRLGNLEAGDRIRVEPDPASAGGEIRARVIEVTLSVQESGVQVGDITGRVTSIDRVNNTVRVATDRGEVRVDLASATDAAGHRVRAADMQIGDRVDVSGSYNGETFVATSAEFIDETPAPVPAEVPGRYAPGPLGAVTIYGTVAESLNNSPQLGIHDAQSGQTLRLYVLEDFVVRTRTGGTTTADHLHDGDAVIVKAYRDSDGNYIAQTIRLR